MSELKKCPFCGVNEWKYQSHFSGTTIYQCEKCGTIVEEWVVNTRPIEDALNARIAELEAEVTKCHELQDSYCDRIAELEAVQRWIPVSERLPDGGHREFYEVACIYQDFGELALFSKGRWIIYEGTSVYDITDRVVFWRRRQPLPDEVIAILSKGKAKPEVQE